METGALSDLPDRLRAQGEEEAAAACGVGLPTLRDVVKELLKPGRDPRDELPPPLLRTDVMDMKDLKPGMELQGTVRNVIDFGAFVDVGVHQDGLVHITQLPRRAVHPSRSSRWGMWSPSGSKRWTCPKRISLTMKQP